MRSFFACFLIVAGCVACTPEVNQRLDKVSCQINKPCNYSDGISISLGSESVEPETPFTIILKAPKNQIVHQAKLEGVDMYMGTIPVFFTEQSTGVWQAQVMVGACSLSLMQWRLMVQLAPTAAGEQNSVAGNREIFYSIYVSRHS
ncbi:hypothetical protein ORJ66_13515 [Pseudoalteromonas tunicata]|uniref:hypothetical protein n=1 Tax=Pseudoalteromonas tunicata TaxID=314281 RepID=UPI00273DA879|nr:hypothetical protein [Pseudoalteromonas tunicata]MDP5214066.1 hypothetical protein [Pseudoalteromonas tunicata]